MTILILTNGNTITVKQSIYIILEMINSGDKFLDLSSLDYNETCQATGEILSGGNTFVFVEFDWDFRKKLNNIFSVQFDNEPSSIDLFGLKLHKIDFGFRVEYRDQNNQNYGNIEGMGINVYERLLLMGKKDQCKMLFKVA